MRQVDKGRVNRVRTDRGWAWLIGTAAILIAVLVVIAYAWIDGGRVPLRTIVDPVGPQLSGAAAHSRATGR